MASGILQLFQHVTLWSRFPTALTAMNPNDASALVSSHRSVIDSLNRYVGEMRLQEIGLLKALGVDPDELQSHLEKEKPFVDFFSGGIAPDWFSVHPRPMVTLDDIQQFRNAITGAKKRLNSWSRKSSQPRPTGLSEHMVWMQEFARTRAHLARLSVQLGEPQAGIAYFYDVRARSQAKVLGIEESLAVYFQIQRAPRPPR